MRVSAVLIAFAMLAGSLLLIQQQRADAAPAAAVTLEVPAQINIQAIVCPILLSVRAAFSSGPFGGFVTPILNQLLVAFGCSASG